MTRFRAVSCLFAILLGACTHAPIVDMRGVDQAKYQADLQDCYALAEQVSPVREGLIDTIGGALFGTILGIVTAAASPGGSLGTGAALGAGIGGVIGGGSGISGAFDKQDSVVQQCLVNRGYKVAG